MKIEAVDFFYLSMPVETDAGDGSQDALVVRVAAGGHVGWGECEASPLVSIAAYVCPMSHGACRPVLDSVLGQDLSSPDDIARIAVLFRGEVMETGPTAQIFSPPFHPYTHALLQSVPRALQRPLPISSRQTGPTPTDPNGCAYAARCAWKVGAICDTTRPPWQEMPGGLRLRCHLPLSELTELAERTPVERPA